MRKVILVIVGFSLALMFISCSNKDLQNQHSGFLKSYDDMQENDSVDGAKIYISPDVDFTKYENIYIEPVQVVSRISKEDLTLSQTILFEKITSYLTQRYKDTMLEGTSYRLVNDKTLPNTLVFEAAISAVVVSYDDMSWYQFTPVTLGVTAVARSTYVNGSVRILGEARLVDASDSRVLLRAIRLEKGQEVKTDADELVFSDVKPSLDIWLKKTNENIIKLKKGLVK
jgi:hypothetical protein